MKKVLLLCFLAFFSGCASAQIWKGLTDSVIHYYNSSEYEKGIVVGEKAVKAAKDELGETHPDYATSLNNLAVLYQKMGQYDKAEPLNIQAKDIRRKTLGVEHPDYATSLNNLALLYVSMGQYEKAEPLYIQAKDIYRKTLGEGHPNYATSLNNLALLYESMGQYEKAEPLYIQSKHIRKWVLGEEHPDYATSLNNLAGLYKSLGEYEKAEPLYIQSKDLRKRVLGEEHPDYASSLHNLAALYQSIGQYEKAELLYTQAKDIRRKTLGVEHPDYATSLNNLASLYESMYEYEKAELLYTQAKDIWKKVLGEEHPYYASCLNNLAGLYESMGQYEKSELLYVQAIDIWKKVLGEEHRDYATALNNLASVYKSMGEYEKAEQLYIQTKGILEKVFGEDNPDYANGLNNLALLYQSMDQYDKAEPLLGMSSTIEKRNLLNVFSVLSEQEKGNLLNSKSSMEEVRNSFLYNYPKASSAFYQENFNLQLLLKSLSLADTRNIISIVQNTKDTVVQNIFNKWHSGKNFLAKQYSLPFDKRGTDLKRIEGQTENLEKELNRLSTEFRNQQKTLQISLLQVQKSIQTGEAVIEFVRFHLYNKKWTDSTIYAAYILYKNDSVPVFVPLCEEKQLQELFDSAGATATSMVSSFYRGIEIKSRNTASLGKELYKLVWSPLEPYLKGITSISYSPAGKLNSIAFNALPVDSTTILMDKYKLTQYISTRQVALRNSEDQTKKPASITLFGNADFTMDSSQLVQNRTGNQNVSTSIYTPQNRGTRSGTWSSLPGTAQEVKSIQQLFDQKKITSKTLTEVSASEENLKALSGNSPQVLHIATHGFFLPATDKKGKETGFGRDNTYSLADDPLLRNGLILAGGNYAWSGKTPVEGVEDGIVTAYEISQLNLSKTELVVLSACETALGEIKGSEGVFGLQRAFKMAGVKKMIVSLWQVPDKETAELMTAFYSYWLNGKTIEDAFTQAQADMRKKYSPFYWAAFVLVE